MTDYWPSEKEQVTVIRYRVVFEEAVMSRDEFESANQKIRELEENVYFLVEKANFVDWGWCTDDTFQYVVKGPEGYIAFEGDVTSGSDDLVAVTPHSEWSHDLFEPVPIVSNDFWGRLRSRS